MNFKYQCFIVCSMLIVASNAFDTNNALTYAVRQYTQLSEQLAESDPSQFITTADPQSTTWYTTGISGWTVGFYGGTLWTLYNLTMDNYWKDLAIEYQQRVASRQYNPSDHDVGFVIMSTYGLCLEYTGDTSTIAVINQAATTLSERFHPLVRAIRSWDNWDGVNEVKIIADNMMNLELLFRATELSGNTSFSSIGISHADRTIQDHFRNDGKDGTFHVVGYEEATGNVSRKYNVQGLHDNSTWSRGLAWVTHGYITSYIKTNNDNYLKYAEIAGDYFMSHLPSDFVAFWDFDADNETQYQPRDTAAAAIAAHAFLKLYTVTGHEKYFTVADSILENLNNLYRSDGNDAYQIHSILVNGTVHLHDGNLNTAIVYADFYFLQALKLYREIEAANLKSSSNPISVIGKIVLSQVTLLHFIAIRCMFSF